MVHASFSAYIYHGIEAVQAVVQAVVSVFCASSCVIWKPHRWTVQRCVFNSGTYALRGWTRPHHRGSHQKNLLFERWRHTWSQYSNQMVQEISCR